MMVSATQPADDGASSASTGIGNSAGGTADADLASDASTDEATQQAARIKEARLNARTKTFHWLVFSVVFALLPTLGNATVAALQGESQTLAQLALKGDLYIVCMGLTATSIGQALIRKGEHRKGFIATVSTFNIVLLASVVILSGAQDDPKIDQEMMGRISLSFFVTTVITTAIVTYFCELELPE
ncbi:hypothetical protein [Streptomyces sp. NPDC126514]|uniref:hypothetical protein n=1 Tax=Streptomyces sp. NPDC126514 TaxID=3155210 RepID=UPI0033189CE8